jgi:hypothetical protein
MNFEEMLDELIRDSMRIMLNSSAGIDNTQLNDDVTKLKAKLLSMHAAATDYDNRLHLRPRQAQTRDGKAVGDVPEDGKRVLVHCDAFLFECVEFWQQGSYRDGYDAFGGCEDGVNMIWWKDVNLWYSLPTIETDNAGNLLGLFKE